MLLRRLAALALAVTGTMALDAEPDADLRQLNGDNFKASIAHGAWLVEHFSPRCWHCKAFAPTWADLAKKKEYHERLSGFHMAQVNCLAQGDLCNDNNIRGYPSIMLYADGKLIGEYTEDRAYPVLEKWIEDKATAYARGEPLGETKTEDWESPAPAISRPNPEGKVVEVDEAGLDQLKADGPVFVDFFAPWCSHCKKLRPTYEKLAKQYQGALNVVAVNCDDHQMVCKRNGIAGYPTIKLFQDGQETVFEKHRTLDLMTEFIEAQVKAAPMRNIKDENFADIVAQDNVFFVYLTNFDTSLEEIEQVKKVVGTLGLKVPVYTTSDPLFYTRHNIAMPPPTSVLLAFSGHSPEHAGSVVLPAKDQELERFVQRNRYPNFYDLTSDTYNGIFQSEQQPLVVLGVTANSETSSERREMIKMARAWKKAGRPFEQPILFVAADAAVWNKWLAKMFGITESTIPTLIAIDTNTRVFYDTTIEGTRAGYNGADAFSLLEGAFQKFITGKQIEGEFEWGGRSASELLVATGQWSATHPFMATMALFAGVVLFIFALSRCTSRRSTHRGGGYMNEKGDHRLD